MVYSLLLPGSRALPLHLLAYAVPTSMARGYHGCQQGVSICIRVQKRHGRKKGKKEKKKKLLGFFVTSSGLRSIHFSPFSVIQSILSVFSSNRGPTNHPADAKMFPADARDNDRQNDTSYTKTTRSRTLPTTLSARRSDFRPPLDW